jgi:transporter family-2 protein
MNLPALLLAICVGALLPLQALVNARLGQFTLGAVFASLASFVVGTAALLALWLAWRAPAPAGAGGLADAPWWAWTGGLIGAAFVVSATVLVPRLGAAALVCLVVFGQLVGSLLLDHFGVLHPAQPVDATKLAGVALVGVGMLLVVRPWQAA